MVPMPVLARMDGIDYHSVNSGQGGHDYRSNPPGLERKAARTSRVRHSARLARYNVGFNNGGNWGNYTRTFPGRNLQHLRCALQMASARQAIAPACR